jgi:hypothetical protein
LYVWINHQAAGCRAIIDQVLLGRITINEVVGVVFVFLLLSSCVFSLFVGSKRYFGKSVSQYFTDLFLNLTPPTTNWIPNKNFCPNGCRSLVLKCT